MLHTEKKNMLRAVYLAGWCNIVVFHDISILSLSSTERGLSSDHLNAEFLGFSIDTFEEAGDILVGF